MDELELKVYVWGKGVCVVVLGNAARLELWEMVVRGKKKGE